MQKNIFQRRNEKIDYLNFTQKRQKEDFGMQKLIKDLPFI